MLRQEIRISDIDLISYGEKLISKLSDFKERDDMTFSKGINIMSQRRVGLNTLKLAYEFELKQLENLEKERLHVWIAISRRCKILCLEYSAWIGTKYPNPNLDWEDITREEKEYMPEEATEKEFNKFFNPMMAIVRKYAKKKKNK